ncbi:MAG: hypothetical protein GX610_00385 [Rhodococcus sp.]|nr:hypothetical protein [Rhodococcus sp. (in: high G+C Gram-positive bacteria)]
MSDPYSAPPQTVMDLLQGSPVGEALNTPLPATPMEALQNSPLGPLLDTPVDAAGLPVGPELPPLPQLPPLPPNPIDAILQGLPIPALPGIDELFKPLMDLAGSFGTGSLGAFDPTAILSASSGMIDQAMSMSMTGLKVLDQVWESDAAQAAQTQGRQAQVSGAELSERGDQISTTTQSAAASVARGNANLATISQSFAATATAAAPMIMTPPGQAMLLASAAEHLKAAIGVVTNTRTELSEQTLTMNGLAAEVPVPPPPAVPGAIGGQSPFALASTVIEKVGQPMISTVTSGIEEIASTHAAGVSAGLPSGSDAPLRTTPSAAGIGGGGSAGGALGGIGGGMIAGGAGAAFRGPSAPAAPAAAAAPASGAVGAPTSGSTIGGATGSTMGGAPMGGMGAMGAGARGGGDDESGRSTPSYLVNAADQNAFVSDLPMVTPAVIGGEDHDEDPFSAPS